MKKSILAKLLGLATYFLIMSPFFLIPDDMVYIKKGTENIYQPYIHTLFMACLIIIFAFAIEGVVSFWNRILKNTKD
jgi:hypothetical protein